MDDLQNYTKFLLVWIVLANSKYFQISTILLRDVYLWNYSSDQ